MFLAPFKRIDSLDPRPSARLGRVEAERQANLLRVPRQEPPRLAGHVLPESGPPGSRPPGQTGAGTGRH